MTRILPLLLAVLAIAAPATAQTNVTNPTRAEFTASLDHAAITSYEIAWFSGAAQVGAVVDLGKPTPDANQLCTATIQVMPLTFATYTAKVRAKVVTGLVGAPIYSEWSAASNAFDRAPGNSGTPIIKK